MFKFFNIDSKVYQYLLKYSQLLWVSILTLVCSIPLVTIGASVTAMHKLLYQIRKDEETGITRTFFRTFRDNFRQSTLIWLLCAAFFGVIYLDYTAVRAMQNTVLGALSYVMPVILIIGLMCLVWVFVLQSRYQNTVFGTIKLAFIVGVSHPLQTLVMLILFAAPFLLLVQFMAYAPLALGVAFPLCGLLRAMVYSKIFQELEQPEESAKEMEENGTER
jgi:uncharacterized membrane protein YesL